ncbi:hypothetical protein M422DRAFT_265974 [Sphaerobolus stellatus SS14]|uniref:Uncharacterized protein n=1 Tax=Sphaerobolus stellatus (strain SS14) TaxID=990650 RepID=A0A0C9USS6_SPHS4|nr:hypothetical protein M422DRAFT_265974 [Sphaerobolus stellatus SS14]
MPAISAFRGVKDWTNVYDTVLERGRGLLRHILNHPTDALRARLKVGGNLRMFPALRCMEWMRRRLTLRDPDSTYSEMLHALLQECDLVLAQEQWRRWAITSFALPVHDVGWNQARGAVLLNAWLLWMECMMRTKPDGYQWFTSRWQSTMPGLVDEISKDAQLRERNVEPEHLCVRHSSSNWTLSTVIKEVKAWCQSMDEGTFNNGSVVERFLWTYSVHMMSEMGQGEEAWCIEATTKGCEWLLKAAETLEADILLKRAVVCRSVPAASEQRMSKPAIVEGIARCDSVNTALPELKNRLPSVDIDGGSDTGETQVIMAACGSRAHTKPESHAEGSPQKIRTSSRLKPASSNLPTKPLSTAKGVSKDKPKSRSKGKVAQHAMLTRGMQGEGLGRALGDVAEEVETTLN